MLRRVLKAVVLIAVGWLLCAYCTARDMQQNPDKWTDILIDIKAECDN